jgi:hypothetical protein
MIAPEDPMARRVLVASIGVLVLAVLSFALLATAALAAAQDPFTGTWALNHAKSHLPPPVPRSVVSHIQCDDKGVSVREEIVDADGTAHTATARAGFDGKDYPVVGTPLADTVSYRRVDARTLEGTSKKSGKVLVHETVVVSPDGRTMTATYTGQDAQGKEVVGTAVFDRR